MNPVKAKYAFVDLLKLEAVIPFLIALDQNQASRLDRVATVASHLRAPLVTSLLAFLQVAAAADPLDIVRRAARVDDSNFQIARRYTFVQRVEERSARSTKSETYDILFLYGAFYRRLIARNDQPLSPQEEKKQQEKMDRQADKWRRKPPVREARERERTRAVLRLIPDAYDFRLAGEETLAERSTWVLEATPKPGYRPPLPDARYLPKLRGRLWIDKTDYHWVRVQVEVIETISFGLFLARIGPGSGMDFEQIRVNDEVWLPRRILLRAAGRVGLVKKVRSETEITYRDFRKFQTDTDVRFTEPRP